MGECGLDQVLGGAAQRDEDVMIVRIDSWAATYQVGQDCDGSAVAVESELPALRVVAGGG
jgi:hypothetical protein